MAATAKGYPYPAAGDPNNVPADIQALAEKNDARPGVGVYTTAQRDALAGVELWTGRIIWNTTTAQLERYSGGAWAAATAGVTFGSSGDIVASAVGDTVAAGATGKVADAGHRHAREAFGAVTAQTTFGASSGNGAAGTVARSDHTHGTPATPSAAAVGAVALTGGTMTGQLFVNLDYPVSGSAGVPAIALGSRGSLQSRTAQSFELGDNIYYDGSNYRLRETGGTRINSILMLFNGQLQYKTAPQGAAGSIAALTQRFSVDSAGRLDATTIYDGGNRVYSASNPPPASGAVITQTIRGTVSLPGGGSTTVNSTISLSNSAKAQLTMNGAPTTANLQTGSFPQLGYGLRMQITSNTNLATNADTAVAYGPILLDYQITEWS